ncbi:MAG: RNA pseudouridine synthase [Treponema sp.]|jgi:23S rRNA pseudouridine1911/1915/1917 synthase|nr:RNA pseudouridine synthase [Treponema sp.]
MKHRESLPAQDLSIEKRILFSNSSCMVINKAPGESTEPLPGPGMIDLPRLLAEYRADLRPLPVHRLDVPVTGCVLFALNGEALRFLGKAFREGKTQKSYWAITEFPPSGKTLPNEGEMKHWIGAGHAGANKVTVSGTEGPALRESRLRYRIFGRGEHYLFWEIELLSGRHHQIRAQLAHEGFPVKGDLKYGARRSEKAGGIRLHARDLSFPDPESSSTITVSCFPPLEDNLWLAFREAILL